MNKESCFGFVALLGRPNAGKSSLLNSIVGKKISAVSQKPQTTRNRLIGLKVFNNFQFAFIDTPGLHNTKGMSVLNSAMMHTALQSINDADAVFYIIDVKIGITEEDIKILKTLSDKKTLIVISKVDKVPLKYAENVLRDMNILLKNDSRLLTKKFRIILGSSKSKEYTHSILTEASRLLPQGQWLYPEDQMTDVSQSFVCSELVREQIFRSLGQELPYTIGVLIESLVIKESHIHVFAKIYLSKPSHKSMIIGKNGEKIKQIGIASRISLENYFSKKVVIKMFVAVSENWVNSVKKINEIQNMDLLNVNYESGFGLLQ